MCSSCIVAKVLVLSWIIFHLSKYMYSLSPNPGCYALFLCSTTKQNVEWKTAIVLNFLDYLTSCSVLVFWAVPWLIFQQVELILTSKLFIPKQSCWQVQIQMADMWYDFPVLISASSKGMRLRDGLQLKLFYSGQMWSVLNYVTNSNKWRRDSLKVLSLGSIDLLCLVCRPRGCNNL